MEGTNLTGDTQQHTPPEQTYIYISEIYDEFYDEEMDCYTFDFYTYSGMNVSLRLRKKDIERFSLFMKKEEAHQRYFKHILNQ